MASIIRQKKASVDVALRRNRDTTYTEPLMKRGDKKSPEEMDDIKAYLSNFYRTIYKRSDECHAILKEHPNTVAVHFSNLVPKQMSYEDFWQRYFYRCDESRLIAEWDRAAEKGRKARAARAEEIHQSLQKSLRNIQDALVEVAATGLAADAGISAPAGATSSDDDSAVPPPPKEAFLPPILGPDAPDTKPITKDLESTPDTKAAPVDDTKQKPKSEPSLTIEDTEVTEKLPVKSTSSSESGPPLVNDSGKMSPPPKTAAGEATQEAEPQAPSLDVDVVSPLRVERETAEPQSLEDMIAAANEVDRKSPRSKQLRVSPKVEPKVISFWKSPTTAAPSTPKLTKEADAARGTATESAAVEKKADKELNQKQSTNTNIPHDLKRTVSKVADRIEAACKKRRKDEPSGKKDEADTNKASAPAPDETGSDADEVNHSATSTSEGNFSNTSVMLLILPVLLALLAAMLFNTDLACAAVQPGMELFNESISSEAPWWAPTSVKEEAFSIVCPSRIRTSLEWTEAGGRGDAIRRLVVKAQDEMEGGRILFDKRNLRNATVSPASISYVNKKGVKEKVPAPWTLNE